MNEKCFLCNGEEIKVLGSKDNPLHDKKCSDSRFSITVFRVGSVAGVNGPVIFLAKGTKLHHRIKGTNLVIIYVSLEVSCVIPNKAS